MLHSEAALSDEVEDGDGFETMPDNAEFMLESWTGARKNTGAAASENELCGMFYLCNAFPFLVRPPTVKLVAPPAGHPTTSILRPVVTPNPGPEDDHEAKPFSPLDYTTNIGDASVVHKIYLEARNTGVPRTEEQELARHRRATQMLLREIQAVAKDVKWHQEGRGFEAGPRPSVLQGMEHVPKEEKRKWLIEKRRAAIQRRTECRLTVLDNIEAADHIFVVYHALRVCRQAGAQGIIF